MADDPTPAQAAAALAAAGGGKKAQAGGNKKKKGEKVNLADFLAASPSLVLSLRARLIRSRSSWRKLG
jgi:hypothetical protein